MFFCSKNAFQVQTAAESQSYNLDQQEAEYVIDSFTNGFELGMSSFPDPGEPCKNSAAAQSKPEITLELINKEIEKGHMLGPFDSPPLEGMVYSPIHLVKKAGSKGKYCLIHNLSFPYDGKSVNSCILPGNASVKYKYIDNLINLAVELRENIFGCRIDIQHAYRNLWLKFWQIKYMGFTWQGKFYINVTMPFGGTSSCRIFEHVATVLQWIVTNETGWRWISHYLDDYSMLGKTQEELELQIQKFVDIMTRIGMPVADKKTLGPMQFLEYLGLLLNLLNLTLQIPDNKRLNNIERIDKLLAVYRGRRKTTVKKLQKLAGSLNFICSEIPAGKVFLASLYKLTRSDKGQVNPLHHRRITKEVYEDLTMFKSFLEECADYRYHGIPFMIKQEKFNN